VPALGKTTNAAPRWPGFAALALLLIQPVVFFRSVLVSQTRHIPFDIEEFHLPLTSFIARCVREHVWPFWNPYSYCGMSMWADIQAQLFYPFTWGAVLLGNLTQGRTLFFWMEALIPLHMALGGIFAYLFARRLRCAVPVALFAATTYQLGAFFASQAQHLGAICAAAWFPLLLWCVLELADGIEMRWIGVTAMTVTLVIVAGFPAATDVILISTIAFAGALMIVRMSDWLSLAALLAGMVTGILIAAVQLIPTAQAYSLTIAQLRADWLPKGGGLPLHSLASFFWPNFYHEFSPFDHRLYRLPFNFTFLYTYCGHLALLFLILAPAMLFLRRGRASKLLIVSLGLTLVSAVWMIGDTTPIYIAIYSRLPRILRGSLYAEEALIPFSFWVSITAALSLRDLPWNRLEALSWVVALAASVNLIAVSSNRPMNTARGSYEQENSDYALGGNEDLVKKLQQFTRSAYPPVRLDYLNPAYGPINNGAEMYRLPSAIGDSPLLNLRYYYFRRSFTGDVFWDRG
jgi:hypothetical protein